MSSERQLSHIPRSWKKNKRWNDNFTSSVVLHFGPFTLNLKFLNVKESIEQVRRAMKKWFMWRSRSWKRKRDLQTLYGNKNSEEKDSAKGIFFLSVDFFWLSRKFRPFTFWILNVSFSIANSTEKLNYSSLIFFTRRETFSGTTMKIESLLEFYSEWSFWKWNIWK